MSIYNLGTKGPDIAKDAWIAPGAHVIGDVVLGPGASVWFGAVLRGDNERLTIGAGSNIQENSILHTDMGFPLIVGEGCTLGHNVIVHGCHIGDNTLIGMGATIMNGARIGRDCLIGAGALVTEGKVIPDGSMVLGAPGKVVRALDEEAIGALRESARHYRDNAARFRADLAPVR
ncbi:MAG TPA: gamma carbonic anhydrase family protein [Aliiroseovarius sp.]|nr:gamma carbonic anhydrase family protein [Aliiroseovarius sp.]